MKYLRPAYFVAGTISILLVARETVPWLTMMMGRAEGPAVRLRYLPAGAFVPGTTTSPLVNVDEYGIRSNGASRRDVTALDNAIWAIGGSTTFGAGVADHETIPARLEALLGRPVINLAVWGNGSVMENRLFSYYMRTGFRPAAVIFLEGIDEACEADVGDDLSARITRSQHAYAWPFGSQLGGLLAAAREWVRGPTPGAAAPNEALSCVHDGMRNPLSVIHERSLAERDALCRVHDVRCRTFVLPSTARRRALFEHLDANWRAHGATWLTGTLEQGNSQAAVDETHDSADANRLIATAIAASLDQPKAARP